MPSFQWDGDLSQCDNGDQDPGYWVLVDL